MQSENRISEARLRMLRDVVDPDLARIIDTNKLKWEFVDDFREAFVLLERRIRERTGLPADVVGKELIDKAFNPDRGILQPASSVGAERAGLNDLLRGLFLLYRNPIAHRSAEYVRDHPVQVMLLIDHALAIVDRSAETSLDLAQFVGINEGRIKRRRDFRIDIDGDGDVEIVSMVEFGAVLEEGRFISHLVPVILKKNDQGYRRIVSEPLRGESIYGAVSVSVRNITGGERPDLVVYWAWGETQELCCVLRFVEGQYVIVDRSYPEGTTEPYSGPHGRAFNIHSRQTASFVDLDGDGIDEIVQELFFDPEDPVYNSYKSSAGSRWLPSSISRVHKFDPETGRIAQIIEQVVRM